MNSTALTNYHKEWQETATKTQLAFVDKVYEMCEKNYENGGDEVVEPFAPAEILEEFKTLKEVKDYCGARVEYALEFRYGEDSDPELIRYNKHKNWKS